MAKTALIVILTYFTDAKSMMKNHFHGQALIEYLLIFCFIAFISLGFMRGMGNTIGSTIGILGYELTEQFSVGVCPQNCFFKSYVNQKIEGP